MVTEGRQLAEDIESFCGEDPQLSVISTRFSRSQKESEGKMTKLTKELSESILAPTANYLARFEDIKNLFKKRRNYQMDYENKKRKYQSSQPGPIVASSVTSARGNDYIPLSSMQQQQIEGSYNASRDLLIGTTQQLYSELNTFHSCRFSFFLRPFSSLVIDLSTFFKSLTFTISPMLRFVNDPLVSAPTPPQPLTIDKTLSSAIGTHYFEEFSRQKACAENILFIKDVEFYNQVFDSSSGSEIIFYIISIYNNFISPTQKVGVAGIECNKQLPTEQDKVSELDLQEINIDSDLRFEIRDLVDKIVAGSTAVTGVALYKNMFDKAKASVASLMKLDTFPKFLLSPLSNKVIESWKKPFYAAPSFPKDTSISSNFISSSNIPTNLAVANPSNQNLPSPANPNRPKKSDKKKDSNPSSPHLNGLQAERESLIEKAIAGIKTMNEKQLKKLLTEYNGSVLKVPEPEKKEESHQEGSTETEVKKKTNNIVTILEGCQEDKELKWISRGLVMIGNLWSEESWVSGIADTVGKQQDVPALKDQLKKRIQLLEKVLLEKLQKGGGGGEEDKVKQACTLLDRITVA